MPEQLMQMNWRQKLPGDRGNYNYKYGEWEIFLKESIDNCIDADAKKVIISVTPLPRNRFDIRIEDNGNGIDLDGWKKYHKLGGGSKWGCDGTIGFIGQGSKLCLDLCNSIYTETVDISGRIRASRWRFKNPCDEIPYSDSSVTPRNLLKGQGLLVEAQSFRAGGMTQNTIKEVLQHEYGFADINIQVEWNGTNLGLIRWSHRTDIINCTETGNVSFKFSKKSESIVYGFFRSNTFLPAQGLPTPGLFIIVRGKTIKMEGFLEHSTDIDDIYKKQIYGFIRCDKLAREQSLKSSKDGFKPTDRLWKNVKTIAGNTFYKWLKQNNFIKHKIRRRKIPSKIRKVLEAILEKFPELGLDKPTGRVERDTLIDGSGNEDVAESDVGQKVPSDENGPNGPGNGKPTTGMNDGKGVKRGTGKKGRRSKRSTMWLSPILRDSEKQKQIYEAEGSLIINTKHPAYLNAVKEKSGDYYTISILLDYLVRTHYEDDDEVNQKIWEVWEVIA